MTLVEALKLLTRWQEGKDITSFDDVNRAVKLGIEALKQLQEGRKVDHAFAWHRLPGETEE